MNFIKSLWQSILKLLGFVNVKINDIGENDEYEQEYIDTSDTNFTAIMASKLASLTLVDSDIQIDGDNQRAKYMQNKFTKLWKHKMKKVVTSMLGIGGVFIFPKVSHGELSFDLIPQSRVSINKSENDEIISVTMLAEIKKIGKDSYYRWVSYDLDQEKKVAKIENLVTDSDGNPTSIDLWSDLKNFYINNVEHSLFSFFKSPINNRNFDDIYGVPVTYGAKKTIERILETLEQIDTEFKNKEVKVFADERLFTKDGSTGKYSVSDKFFKILHGSAGQQSMMDIFSPEIRDSSYYNKLVSLMSMLEIECGVSAGILTKAESRNATATEIKANNVDTYSLISDIHNEIEQSMDELKYACDVLLNYFGVVPQGDYDFKINWSYLLVENSQEAFEQLMQAKSVGAVSKTEVRQWVYPDETLEESETKIKEIEDLAMQMMNNYPSKFEE